MFRFAETSLDGVYTHGINRFPLFIKFIREGHIHIHAEPEKLGQFGVIERWNGNRGPGNLNARFAMTRAIEAAKEQGMACVALSNTNHWMRAGTYGLLAAEAGCIAICWSNTIPNMPAWGAKSCRIGNTPVMMAIPRQEGPLLLDTAMSMFSYGQLNAYQSRSELLPVDGGYDIQGELTRVPSRILETERLLPIGFWKGSGLSFMFDMIGMFLSGGRSSKDIAAFNADTGMTQIFIVMDTEQMPDADRLQQRLNEVIDDFHRAEPAKAGGEVRYPGEGMLRIREENRRLGIPVDPAIWADLLTRM